MPLTRSQSKKDNEDFCKSDESSDKRSKKTKTEKCVSSANNEPFGKNSFDRFGDDLCEVLLSYLPIGDKFRLECISRQWQRLIFNRQYKVVLDFYEMLDQNTIQTPKDKQKYNQLFAHLFRKLKNLKDIECHHFFNTKTFDSIITDCEYIERMAFNGPINKDLLNRLFEKFGKRLIGVDLNGVFNKRFDNVFKMTPNLKEVKLNKHLNHLIETFLPKLVDITFPLNVSSELMTEFTAKYFKQIKIISIRFDQNSTTDEINKCLTQISKFDNLQSLTLKLRMTSKSSSHLDSGLKLIGIKCKKLQSFSLKSSHYITNENLLSVLNKYQSLVRLKVFIDVSANQTLGTVAELNSSLLKYFTLEFNGITDDTFTDIHIFLPNLKSFQSNDCITNNLTNQTLNSFAKLQTLRSLSLIGKQFTETGALNLINNCPQIACLDINYDTTKQTIEAMSGLAFKHPKRAYKLYVNTWPNKQLLKLNINKLPINLSIIQF